MTQDPPVIGDDKDIMTLNVASPAFKEFRGGDRIHYT
jgi:hypothetical protein